MNLSRRGLTFLEVSVVILIIGLLAAIGTPHFVRAARLRATRNAAIELASYVDYVRSAAINEGTTTTLIIDGATDHFSSPNVEFPDRVGNLISIAVKERFDPSLELSADFDSENAMQFDLEGTPWANNGLLTRGTIRITSYDVGFEIRIGAGRGQVTINEVSVTPLGQSAPDARSSGIGEI